MKNDMYFAGIDPSLTATAIAIVDGEGKLVCSNVISSKLSGPTRLAFIRDIAEIDLKIFPIKLICIEHYAMGCKFGREAAGELGGVLRVMMFENEFVYHEIPPLRLKQFATGKASAEKDHILMAVYKKWGIEFEKNDEADAFILAQMARAIYKTQCINAQCGGGDELGLTGYEREVIHNVLNSTKKGKKKKTV